MPVIAVLNQKGGTGKSTVTFHLGGALAKLGRRVLLIDNDPQSSVTQAALGARAAAGLAGQDTLAAVYAGDAARAADVVAPLAFPGLFLLPNSEHSAAYNVPSPHASPWASQTALVQAVADLSPKFDVVIVDNPPNLYLATWAALAASDFLIIPVQPEDFGVQGLSSVDRSVKMVAETVNPGLELLGVLISMFARKTVHLAYDALLREKYGPAVFAARVPHSVDFPEATMRHKPVGWHKPRGVASRAVDGLAGEVLARVAASDAAKKGAA